MLIKYIKAKITGLIKTGAMKICPYCKTQNLKQSKVCCKCGYRFEKEKL